VERVKLDPGLRRDDTALSRVLVIKMAKKTRHMKAMAAIHYDLFTPEDLTPPPPATLSHHELDELRRQQEAQRVQLAVAGPSQVPPTPGGVGQAGPVSRESKAPLPTIEELYRRFDYYNVVYFKGRLRRARIEYSKRMTSAGSYTPSQRLIKIGYRYHLVFPGDINDTLKHEMLHIRYYRHDARFKAEAKRIGCTVKAQSHPSLARPAKYIYVCPGCGAEYPRQKRLRMASCGDCSRGGKYDERFKLKLVYSRAKEAGKKG
jgi:predicted SprT family Zn-dependent metalloprotease